MNKYNNLDMFREYPDLLSVSGLQDALNISKNTAYKLIRKQKIKHWKIGRSIKIPKHFLLEYVMESCYDNSTTKQSSCHFKEEI